VAAKHSDLPAATVAPKEFPDPVVAKIPAPSCAAGELERVPVCSYRMTMESWDRSWSRKKNWNAEAGTGPEPDDAGYLTEQEITRC
jgi:hypothetical protein